jgi:2-methylisocitrate lyase-like PEP mutase family enzyme
MGREDLESRRAAFQALHGSGCFVIPNPWDIGSAKYLQHLGFKALATTSAGFAFSRGLPDSGRVTLHMVLDHLAGIVAATAVPINADFQSGYSASPEGLGKNVRLCVETGVAGLSIEDSTGDRARPLFELSRAIERIRAAREAIDATRTGVLLTARAECHLVGHPQPLEESVRRLRAYAEAGADVLFAPGSHAKDAIKTIVDAVAPKPVNVLMGSSAGLTVADLAELGVRRISVGSSLARAAWTGFIRAARSIAEDGTFTGFEGTVPYDEINRLFSK